MSFQGFYISVFDIFNLSCDFRRRCWCVYYNSPDKSFQLMYHIWSWVWVNWYHIFFLFFFFFLQKYLISHGSERVKQKTEVRHEPKAYIYMTTLVFTVLHLLTRVSVLFDHQAGQRLHELYWIHDGQCLPFWLPTWVRASGISAAHVLGQRPVEW